MKKFMMFVAMTLIAATQVNAQSAKELAAEEQAKQKVYKKMLDEKPCKTAKKQAKELKKEGWKVNAGSLEMAQQINYGMMMEMELTTDEEGNNTKRYLQHVGRSTAGAYNAAYASARNQAQVELGAAIETKIAAAMEQKIDNSQDTRITSTTVDKFHERAKTIVQSCLTNSIPVLTVYREVKSNFEVQVRLAYDKKELQARLKRKLQQELELEGDDLNELVDDLTLDIMEK